MWITVNGNSRDFFEITDLRSYLDGLSAQPVDHESVDPLSSPSMLITSTRTTDTEPGILRTSFTSQKRGRFLERPLRSQDGRDMALQAVADILKVYTDKKRSPLNPCHLLTYRLPCVVGTFVGLPDRSLK
ncbi:hypothetical protein NDU88_008712 [Pleurodeles waltl]|uniref:Uncharacterized protein n=1 Tax=Pleurodeles waltl TaxID=8319 RepID=A0AAV7QPD6_PLEWA|nr:hypothetical protein NDU88_008712 [Pleurodeles waltl]